MALDNPVTVNSTGNEEFPVRRSVFRRVETKGKAPALHVRQGSLAMKGIHVCLAIILLFTVSCKRRVVITKDFPSVSELTAKTVHVNEIIKFGYIYKLNGYVVISDRSDHVENFFTCTNTPDLIFCIRLQKKETARRNI
jgi:hypothetical protein